MAGYNCLGEERCRYCGFQLPPDPVVVMAHFNNHWRQCNQEAIPLSPCAFEPQLDIRVGTTPLNSEDLEVSSHMEPNFQYAYSPQTEPSNLSIAGTRCSPLNLTGRSKNSSPLSPHNTQPSSAPMSHSVVPLSHVQVTQQQDIINLNTQDSCMAAHSEPQCTIGIMNNNPLLYQMHSSSSSHLSCQTVDMSCSGSLQDGLNNFRKRRRNSERMSEFRCLTCNHTFFTKPSYDEHLQDHVKANSYLMNIDQLPEQNLQNPPACVEVDKPYKCSICDKEFYFKEELFEHTESHEAAKPHKCDICGIGLSHSSTLKRHKLSHSGVKPHQCGICGRSFTQKFDLQRHSAVHSKNMQLECLVCRKKYSSAQLLKSHKCKLSTENKPFKCTICDEGCSSNIAWSYHMWKHTKDPAYVPFQQRLDFPPSQGQCNSNFPNL